MFCFLTRFSASLQRSVTFNNRTVQCSSRLDKVNRQSQVKPPSISGIKKDDIQCIQDQIDNLDWSWSAALPEQDVVMYKKFMICKGLANDTESVLCDTGKTELSQEGISGSVRLRPKLSPPAIIDKVWTAHLLHPKLYFQFCSVLLKGSNASLIDYCPDSLLDPMAEQELRLMEYGRVYFSIFNEKLDIEVAPPASAVSELQKETEESESPLNPLPSYLPIASTRFGMDSSAHDEQHNTFNSHEKNRCHSFPTSAPYPVSVISVPFLIMIMRITGTHFTLQVRASDAVRDIKVSIQKKTGIPAHLARLTFAQKVLDEFRTLSFYNIQDKSALHLDLYGLR